MTSKTTNKYSAEVRACAVRMVLDHEGEHASRWATVASIAAKIGCTGLMGLSSIMLWRLSSRKTSQDVKNSDLSEKFHAVQPVF